METDKQINTIDPWGGEITIKNVFFFLLPKCTGVRGAENNPRKCQTLIVKH